jgi:glycosyltransferase involved in cell wall biosynthesis
MPAMRVALVHDWMNQMGGAEDVLAELVAMYAGAPIFTSIYARQLMPAAWQSWDIRPLWMDKLPGIYQHHQRYLPFYPAAFGGLRLSGYEVVITNKSGFCHMVKAGKAVHVCYCLAPTRYVWQFESYMARENIGQTTRRLLRPLINALKGPDYAAAQRVDHFLAISTEIQARIKQYYGRESTIVYPPVDVADRFQPASPSQVEGYYLVVSRLIPYKRIDLAVQACTRLNLPLLVAGKGRDLERLKAMAGPTVKFLGYVDDAQLPNLMARCKAFLFPGLEDFGITPVQAQAAGRPVLAFAGGGSLDTVIPGVGGAFFQEQTVEAVCAALQDFRADAYDPAAMRAHAMGFDKAVFRQQFTAFVNNAVNARTAG